MLLSFQSITMSKQIDFLEMNGFRDSVQFSISSHLICTENVSEHLIFRKKKTAKALSV